MTTHAAHHAHPARVPTVGVRPTRRVELPRRRSLQGPLQDTSGQGVAQEVAVAGRSSAEAVTTWFELAGACLMIAVLFAAALFG